MGKLSRVAPIMSGLTLAALAASCGDASLPGDNANQPRSQEVARVVPAQEAVAGAHKPALDPHTMAVAEVNKVIGDGRRCEFRYTTAGAAAVGIGIAPDGAATGGAVKLNGRLIALAPATAGGEPVQPRAIRLVAEPIRIKIEADRGDAWEPLAGVSRREATMTFKVSSDLRVDCRGYIDCSDKPITISHRR
jgi:hypothetical protein